jgi:threonine/homoserine efflux transporter RhtA
VQEIVPAIDGMGAANPADATAAASTRLMVRFMYMVYLEKRWRRATSAQSKPWAIYGKEVCAMELSLYGAATRAATADKRLFHLGLAVL